MNGGPHGRFGYRRPPSNAHGRLDVTGFNSRAVKASPITQTDCGNGHCWGSCCGRSIQRGQLGPGNLLLPASRGAAAFTGNFSAEEARLECSCGRPFPAFRITRSARRALGVETCAAA